MPCHASWNGPRWTFGSKGRFTALPAVAFLVLLAGAAPARVVAADLLRRRGRRGGARPVRLQRRARSAVRRRDRALRHRGQRRRVGGGLVLLVLLGLLGRADRDPEDRLRDVARDLRRHLVEVGPRFVLVRDERVLLPVAAEVDALAELLHRGEVLDPVGVDGPQQEPALDGPGGLLAERGLAGLVGLIHDVRDLLRELVARPDALERRRRDLAVAPEERVERGG